MNAKIFCIALLLMNPFIGVCAVNTKNAESFEILAYDAVIKVSSPMKFSKKSGVVFTNETNDKIYLKVEDRPIVERDEHGNDNQKIIKKYMTVKAHETKGMELDFDPNRRILIIPLAPSFQEIELIFGNKTYEIPDPAQRQ